MTDYRVNINGIGVDASYTEDNIQDIFIPLLKELSERQKQKGRKKPDLQAPQKNKDDII